MAPVLSQYLDSPRIWGISNAAGLVPFEQISSFAAMLTNFLSVLLVTGKEVRMRGTEIIKLVLLGNTGISSVQFSRSVMSDSLSPHESQHARPPCPSPSHGVQTHVR